MKMSNPKQIERIKKIDKLEKIRMKKEVTWREKIKKYLKEK